MDGKIGTGLYVFPLFNATFAETAEFIGQADALGYDYLRFYDHVAGAGPDVAAGAQQSPYASTHVIRECFTLMAYAAAVTRRIELAAGVLVLPQRQTLLVAKQAAEIDIMSGGRLILGVGIGYHEPEFRALGMNFKDRAARFEEQIELLRLLWTEDVVNFSGRFHEIENLGLAARPLQRTIPIYFGVGRVAAPIPADAVLERCGRMADGWMPGFTPGAEAKRAVEKVRAAAVAAGRDPEKIVLELNLPVQGKTPAQILEAIKRYREFGARRVNLQFSGRSAAEQMESLKRMAEILPCAR